MICIATTAILASIVIVMQVIDFSESHLTMVIGMGLGISTSPLMMEVIKQLRTKRRVGKLLRELAQKRQNQNEME